MKNIMLHRHYLLVLLLFILTANMVLYYTTFGIQIILESSNGVVIGSIIDLALLTPILFLAWRRRWSIKNIIFGGLIVVRFLIPIEFLEPFVAITWIGFAIEGLLILFEVYVLILLLKHLPIIVHSVKSSPLPTLFSFFDAMNQRMKTTPIIKVMCTELFMFYYALGSWWRKPRINDTAFTLHKNSSLIAVYIMALHSIVLETFANHWWLHAKLPIVSIIVLILNIYSIIFLIGNLQAIRFNPLQIREQKMYLSLGLMKRMIINIDNIDQVMDDSVLLQQKLSKDTIEFIARDLEPVNPQMILKLKNPVKTTFIFGIEKEYKFVAIRADEPERLKKTIKSKMNHCNGSN